MKCNECKLLIDKKDGYCKMSSLEEEDYGSKFYVCKPCATRMYGVVGKIAKS